MSPAEWAAFQLGKASAAPWAHADPKAGPRPQDACEECGAVARCKHKAP